MKGENAEETETIRLDVWLWRARFYKTRALSTAQIAKRGARITRNTLTRKTTKPGATLMIGDIVTFGRSVHIRTVEVLGFGQRRGPATEAMKLYNEVKEGE